VRRLAPGYRDLSPNWSYGTAGVAWLLASRPGPRPRRCAARASARGHLFGCTLTVVRLRRGVGALRSDPAQCVRGCPRSPWNFVAAVLGCIISGGASGELRCRSRRDGLNGGRAGIGGASGGDVALDGQGDLGHPLEQCLTLRATRRTVLIIDSHGFVEASVRFSRSRTRAAGRSRLFEARCSSARS
jgi:hypothetical protein